MVKSWINIALKYPDVQIIWFSFKSFILKYLTGDIYFVPSRVWALDLYLPLWCGNLYLELNFLSWTWVSQWLSFWLLLFAITNTSCLFVWMSALCHLQCERSCLIHHGLDTKMNIFAYRYLYPICCFLSLNWCPELYRAMWACMVFSYMK